jgi:hypothetical protein
MTAEENILAQLTHLLGEQAMSKSVCSGSLLRKLRPLLHAGVVVEERSRAGRRLVVRDAVALQDFIHVNFPGAVIPYFTASRVAGIAGFRNSKVFASDTPEIVSVRAWSDTAIVDEGQPTGAAIATARHGVFSFLLRPRYRIHGNAALVENPLVFLQFERLDLPVDLAIYGHGRVSSRLLEWLASNEAPTFSLLHLPDYDPVGLSEFERLRGRLGNRVRLHLPQHLPALFARFSNPALLANQTARASLANLRQSTTPEARQVVALIDEHNAGLEQEALLLEHLPTPRITKSERGASNA